MKSEFDAMIKTTKIKIGEIFEVEGKMYVIALPTSILQDVNSHGQIVLELQEIK